MVTPESRYAGIDLAWSTRARTGVAAVGPDGALVASGSVRTDQEIDAWLLAHCPEPRVVAVDAPLIVTNATGARDCERLVNASYARFQAGCHPSNTSRAYFDPPRGGELARRHGWGLDPGISDQTLCLEVYPHAAMVGLFRLGRTLKYKKGAFPERRAALVEALGLIQGITVLRLAANSRWAEIRGGVERAGRPYELDAVEDEVDAVLCAHLAWLWANQPGALQVYGSPASGCIVAPPPPAHAPAARGEFNA